MTAEFFNIGIFDTLSDSPRRSILEYTKNWTSLFVQAPLQPLNKYQYQRYCKLRLLLFFNAFPVHHACQNTVRAIFYHCWLLHATAVARREQSAFFPEENIFPRRWLFLITIKFYHRLAGTLVPRDAFVGRAKASLRSELLAFRVLL